MIDNKLLKEAFDTIYKQIELNEKKIEGFTTEPAFIEALYGLVEALNVSTLKISFIKACRRIASTGGIRDKR